MCSAEEFARRIENESLGIRRITNDCLKCKDCIFRFNDSEIFGNTSRCAIYKCKPNEILLGGDCINYKNKFTRKYSKKKVANS